MALGDVVAHEWFGVHAPTEAEPGTFDKPLT